MGDPGNEASPVWRRILGGVLWTVMGMALLSCFATIAAVGVLRQAARTGGMTLEQDVVSAPGAFGLWLASAAPFLVIAAVSGILAHRLGRDGRTPR